MRRGCIGHGWGVKIFHVCPVNPPDRLSAPLRALWQAHQFTWDFALCYRGNSSYRRRFDVTRASREGRF